MRRKILNTVMIIMVLALFSDCFAQMKIISTGRSKDTKINIPDNLEKANILSFTGRIVDMDKKSLANCFIRANIINSKTGGEMSLYVVSDPNGFFEVKASGDSIEVLEIRKRGYLLEKSKSQKLRFSAGQIAALKKPALFFMEKTNKKGIAHASYTYTFWSDKSQQYLIDLSKTMDKFKVPARSVEFRSPLKQKKRGSEKVKIVENTETQKTSGQMGDIRISLLDKDDQGYRFAIKSVSKKTGILFSDNFMHVCPSEGYKEEVVINVPKVTTDKYLKYAYVSAQDGEIYARLILDVKASEKAVVVHIMNDANLNSSRVIELIREDVQYQKQIEIKKVEQDKVKQNFQRRQDDLKRRRSTSGE